MDNRENGNIPQKYKPLSPWAYFGYNILFSLPVIGVILLIIYSFDDSNINLRNYARSFWCICIIAAILFAVLIIFSVGSAVAFSEIFSA